MTLNNGSYPLVIVMKLYYGCEFFSLKILSSLKAGTVFYSILYSWCRAQFLACSSYSEIFVEELGIKSSLFNETIVFDTIMVDT